MIQRPDMMHGGPLGGLISPAVVLLRQPGMPVFDGRQIQVELRREKEQSELKTEAPVTIFSKSTEG